MKRIRVEDGLDSAIDCLREGRVVCYPTETFYGLGIDPWNKAARERLRKAKRRPEEKEWPLIVADTAMAAHFCNVSDPRFSVLARRFWPGPLTLVLPALSGSGSYAIRVSSHPAAQRLVASFGGPIVSSSANLSGEPPCSDPSLLNPVLQKEVSLLIDGGMTTGGLASTIISLLQTPAVVLREGALPAAEALSLL